MVEKASERKTHQLQPDIRNEQLIFFILEQVLNTYILARQPGIHTRLYVYVIVVALLHTTSMICINVSPKLSCSGSDSFATGRSSTL